MPCVNGKECVICFGEADASCMSATYRGGGPDRVGSTSRPPSIKRIAGAPIFRAR